MRYIVLLCLLLTGCIELVLRLATAILLSAILLPLSWSVYIPIPPSFEAFTTPVLWEMTVAVLQDLESAA